MGELKDLLIMKEMKGSEPCPEETVRLIHDTGGVSVLAHPWTLKDPVAVIRSLKEAGLHGVEVYGSDGKLSAYSDLADKYGLLKLGGSDFHGKGGNSESELGSVNLPVLALHEFLQVARPIWCGAIRSIVEAYAIDPSDANLERITRFGRVRATKGASSLSNGEDSIRCGLDAWLTVEERQNSDFDDIRSKLLSIPIQ